MRRSGRHHTGWREFSFSRRSPHPICMRALSAFLDSKETPTIMEFPRAFNEEPFRHARAEARSVETDAVAGTGLAAHNVLEEEELSRRIAPCLQKNSPTPKSPRSCPRQKAGAW